MLDADLQNQLLNHGCLGRVISLKRTCYPAFYLGRLAVVVPKNHYRHLFRFARKGYSDEGAGEVGIHSIVAPVSNQCHLYVDQRDKDWQEMIVVGSVNP